ncbi:MAG: monofunctional biosynthetic peptidoglycan transglycosylase, partial [Sedimentitalea sp.]
MAKASKSKKGKDSPDKAARKALTKRPFRPLRWAGFIVLRSVTVVILGVLALVVLFSVVNPPVTHTMWVEYRRLGPLDRDWVA